MESTWQTPYDQQAPGADGLDIGGILARRKWIVIACTILGMAIGAIIYARTPPTYRSQAQVLIRRKAPASVGLEERSYAPRAEDDFSHPHVIVSPTILQAALDSLDISTVPSLSASDNPLDRLLKNLSAMPIPEARNLYVIGFEGPNAADTRTIVTAVVDAYEGFLNKSYEDDGVETRRLITQARGELDARIRLEQEEYDAFRAAAPLMWVGGEGVNPHQERQSAIETKRANIQLEINQLTAQLNSVEAAARRKDNIAALALVAQAMTPGTEMMRPERTTQTAKKAVTDTRRADLTQRQTQLLPLVLQEEELVARYGDDHPRVKSIRRRIKSTKQFLDELAAAAKAGVETPKLGDLVDVEEETQRWYQQLVEIHIESIRQQLTQLQAQATSLDALFNEESRKAKQLANLQYEDEKLRKKLARSTLLFDAVVKKFDEAKLTATQEGYLFRRLADAGTGYKIAPSLPRILAMATCLSGLIGFGLAYLVDLTDQGFHSPMEISNKLQTPVLGHIPVIEESATSQFDLIEPTICTVHNPAAPETEAFRAIRTALFFSADENRVLQVTSPKPGDGKSTTAANLAVTIANSGKTVLLLDADFRRPRQHRIFGLPNKTGLASVVDGQCEIADASVAIAGVDNLYVMPCGPRPANPSELLSSSQFKNVLETLRNQFDFLIVDTPPVLAVSDPSAVAAQVDSIILCLQVNSKTRPLALRTVELLRDHGATLAGIVINGVGSRDSNYVYNYHARRYGYDYGKDYAYGAEPNGNGHATSDELTRLTR